MTNNNPLAIIQSVLIIEFIWSFSIRSLVRITFFIVILVTNLIAYSQEKESKDNDLGESGYGLEVKCDAIESSWRMVVITVKDKKVGLEEKIKLVEKFIENFPENNKHLKEAKLLFVELKRVEIGVADTNIVEHFFNRKSYRTKTEWFSMSFCGGNFGIGGSLSFITLRWQIFFGNF